MRRPNAELGQRVAEFQVASDELRRTSEQRRLALEAADLGAWDYHFQTGDVFWDERCREMWGMPQLDHVDYSTAVNQIHPDDRAGVDAAVKEALAGINGGAYHREFRVVWPDESVHWIASHGRVYFQGEGDQRRAIRFIGANREVTAEKQAREALRESGERLAAFAAATFEGIVLSERGRILDCNEQFARMVGCSLEALRGMSIEQFLPPEERDRVLENIRAGRDSIIEHAVVRADGSRIIVEVHGHPTQAARRDLRLTAVRDITERKRAEEALKQTERALRARERQLREGNLELERRVAERTALLAETISDLEDFSHSITHDLRAPLRAIRCFAQILGEECLACDRPRAQDHIERITSAAARMDKLIQDVLQYSRLARSELQLAPVDVETLLRGILETYPTFQPPQVEIQIEVALPPVLGNKAALTQCFSNLLGNAIKFVAPGIRPHLRIWADVQQAAGRRQRAESATGDNPQPATRNTPSPLPFVRLWFADNGVGIPKEAQERIFKMFQRLDKSYDGTGVGLTVVRKAVEKMGGRVGVESEPGRGSRFWMELKAAVQAEVFDEARGMT